MIILLIILTLPFRLSGFLFILIYESFLDGVRDAESFLHSVTGRTINQRRNGW